VFRTLRNVSKWLTAAALGSGALFASPALYLTDGTNAAYVDQFGVVTLYGGATNTGSTGAGGEITYRGQIGVWTLNVSTGDTKPVVGSAISPVLDLTSKDTSNAAGSIAIYLTDTDFGPNTLQGVLTQSSASNPGGSVQSQAYFNTSNAMFGGSTAASYPVGAPGTGSAPSGSPYINLGPDSSDSFLDKAAGTSQGPLSNYSLTLGAFLTHSGASTTTFDANFTGVPEPGFYGALAVGLSGLFFITYRRRAKS
jgi:hypothetical protein